jgi:hypothetical protein
VNELNTMFTYEIVWYYLVIYNKVNIFKSKLNPLTIGLRVNKPNICKKI